MYNIIQQVIGRTNLLLYLDMIRTASEKKKLRATQTTG
jgi:hypothetical protein